MAFISVDSTYVLEHIGRLPIRDVRPKAMYDAGHIPTALDIPFDEAKLETVGINGPDEAPDLASWYSVAFQESGVAKDDEVIVYCQTGYHASRVCDMLESEGFTMLRRYDGSFNDWISDPGNPVD